MRLDDKHHIEADRHQFMLRKQGAQIKKGDRKGEYSYETLTYRGKLRSSLKDYLDIDIKKSISNAENVEQLLERFNELEDHIDKKLEEITEGINLKTWNKQEED